MGWFTTAMNWAEAPENAQWGQLCTDSECRCMLRKAWPQAGQVRWVRALDILKIIMEYHS